MIEKKIRPGCQDIWNAFMVQNTNFTIDSDMPLCSYIQKSPPKYLISYEDAKHIHKQLKNKEPDYHKDAFIHFYIDDHKFDGKQSSIWYKTSKAPGRPSPRDAAFPSGCRTR